MTLAKCARMEIDSRAFAQDRGSSRRGCHRVGEGATEAAVSLGVELAGVPEMTAVEVGP